MSLVQEFKEFAVKGNVVDMAVGIVVGAAFNKVVDSLVKDIVMPPLGMVLGGVDFRHLYLNLSAIPYPTLEAAEKAGAAVVRYGLFISNLVDFLVIALSVFVAVKVINRLRREESAPPPDA